MPRCPSCYRRLSAGKVCPQHPESGSPPPPSPASHGSVTLAGYRFENRLGVGGFATVWAAVRERDGAPVAIKVSGAITAKGAQRLQREAEALQRVGPPHVPRVHEHGTLDDGRSYIVMERLTGRTMATWLGDRVSPVSARDLMTLASPVLASLQAVHDAGLTHGDFKPENIFVVASPSLSVRLLDFGIARGTGASLWSEVEREETKDEIVGSAEYMSPEQMVGELSPAADMYAVGVLLYEMMTLRVPFVGDAASIKHGHQTLRPPRLNSFADVPEPLEALCLRCLAKEPGKRPASVAVLREQLTEAVAESAHLHQSSAARPPPRGSSVLVDSRQPVVLLAVEVETGTRAIVHVIERHKGIVARQIGRRYVCGFSALEDAEPIRSALDTAQELVQNYGARIVLHIAQLKVRRRRRGHAARFFGPALQDIRSWKPEREWRGILLTRKLASAMPDDATLPSVEHPDFFEPAPASVHIKTEPTLLRVPVHAPFLGRNDLLARARQSLREVVEGGSPGPMTMIGASGLGKSRMARELATMARNLANDAIVLTLQASRQLLGQSNETLRLLLESLAENDLLERSGPLQVDGPEATRPLGDGLRRGASRPLVVIIDDVHFADGATLDALEYATLDGEQVSLWVAVLGHPRLLQRRPQWGQRANRHVSLELRPLSEAAAMRLAAELLHPAEYPPAATLQRLARWTGGSPHALQELVRTLKREGVVRKRLHSDSWYVATAAIERLPSSPAGQWLAARRLDALPMELSACVRLCAVLGVEFLRDELEWVQNAADRSGGASSDIDTDVGLSELQRLGFVEQRAGAWSFQQAALQDAVYNLVGSRERTQIHDYALEFWRMQAGDSPSQRVLSAIARHAEASRANDEAADAYLELGDRARAAHRDVDADQRYTQASRLVHESDHARMARLLGGRGRVRYRIQRTREAIVDLRTAQVHVTALNDGEMLAELLLEEATALDWEWQFQESASCVERAGPLVANSESEPLRARYLCALGRCGFRQERLEEARDYLQQSVELARQCGDVQTHILALIVLALTLSWDSRHQRALARYDELIALCHEAGDRFHLCAAYTNKGLVWIEETGGHVESDLTQAIQLAREIGQPVLERSATHNLAEFFYRRGQREQALVLARRSYALQRFFPERTHIDTLLVARIHASLGQFSHVEDMLRQTRELATTLPLTQSEEIVRDMLEVMSRESRTGERASDAWDELSVRAREHLSGEELLDLLYFRARTADSLERQSEVSDVVEQARPMLATHPLWRQLFDALVQ